MPGYERLSARGREKGDRLRVVGLYLSAADALDRQERLETLQETVGLNTVILGAGLREGGFVVSDRLIRENPLGPQASEGPGNRWSGDDTLLRRAIHACRAQGLGVWLLVSGWHIGGERHPELCSVDLDGTSLAEFPPVPYALEQRWLPYCPSHEGIRWWLEELMRELVTRYAVDAVDLTHARSTSPSFWPGLFACACPRCQERMEAFGYPVDAMLRGLRAFRAELCRRGPEAWAAVSLAGHGPLGGWQVLGEHAAWFVLWLEARARLVADNVRRLGEAVREARPGTAFGADIYPPSLAPLVGHHYGWMAEACDFLSPLLPHVEVFLLSTWAAWAAGPLAEACVPEEMAVGAVSRILGYDPAWFPRRVSEFGVGTPAAETGSVDVGRLVATELERAASLAGGTSSAWYPVIKGRLWPAPVIRDLSRRVQELGFDGVVYQGTESLLPGGTSR